MLAQQRDSAQLFLYKYCELLHHALRYIHIIHQLGLIIIYTFLWKIYLPLLNNLQLLKHDYVLYSTYLQYKCRK